MLGSGTRLDCRLRGGRSSIGRAPGCGPGGCGFESHRSPLGSPQWPRSSADRAAAFEAACGGSTPPGAVITLLAMRKPHGCVGQTCRRCRKCSRRAYPGAYLGMSPSSATVARRWHPFGSRSAARGAGARMIAWGRERGRPDGTAAHPPAATIADPPVEWDDDQDPAVTGSLVGGASPCRPAIARQAVPADTVSP